MIDGKFDAGHSPPPVVIVGGAFTHQLHLGIVRGPCLELTLVRCIHLGVGKGQASIEPLIYKNFQSQASFPGSCRGGSEARSRALAEVGARLVPGLLQRWERGSLPGSCRGGSEARSRALAEMGARLVPGLLQRWERGYTLQLTRVLEQC